MAKEKEKGRERSLSHVLSGIRKKHGESILREPKEVTVFSTSLKTINVITGIGGFPYGRMIELYSPEGCGKSTLAIQCGAQVQKMGRKVVWGDFEHCFDKRYASSLGLKVKEPELILLRPMFAEKGFDAILRLVDVKEIGLLVVDSIAAATPEAEANVLGFGETQPGLQSRKVTAFIKSLIPRISDMNVGAIFINQLRSAISFNPHMPTTQTTPGGKALKFYASLRIHLQMGKAIKMKDPQSAIIQGAPEKRAVAHIIHVAIAKNKLAVPFRCGDVQLVHGKGMQEVSLVEESEEDEE